MLLLLLLIDYQIICGPNDGERRWEGGRERGREGGRGKGGKREGREREGEGEGEGKEEVAWFKIS